MEEGAKRDRRTPQEASRGAQKGPQSSQNEPQRVQNWERKGFKRVLGRNVRKTSKSTTLSSENRDFGGTEGRKLTENWSKSEFRTVLSSIRSWKGAAEDIEGHFRAPKGLRGPRS